MYLDNIQIYSNTAKENLEHLELSLERLQTNELYARESKCEIATFDTKFLRLFVWKEGFSIGQEQIKIVHGWPIPTLLTELRSFLGLLQFFRRFIRNISHVAIPLTDLTRKGNGIQKYNAECDRAFEILEKKLCSAPTMQPPDWHLPFRCQVDASSRAVGETLSQIDVNGHEQAIAYFSKRLSTTKENYSANDLEILGIVYFLQRFRCYLEGSEFEVITDNQVLRYFFSKPSLSRREARWLEFHCQFGISQLTLQKGLINVLGDVLSRVAHAPLTITNAPLTLSNT